MITFENGESAPLSIREMLISTYTDGIIVMKDGTIPFEQYFNGMNENTSHLLM
jgi:hypothetical protein